MACGVTPSILDSSPEITNGFKLMRLIVDGGTEALRKTFMRYRAGDLQVVLSTFKPTLLGLKGKYIKQNQWDKLFPTPPIKPNIIDLDITLMCILLRHICGLSPPSSAVWKNEPTVSDHSVEADIVRIRLFRNERFGHIPNTAVSSADFKVYWAEVSSPLVRLGIDQKEIDGLENEKCGREEVERIFKEWKEWETDIIASMYRMEHRVESIEYQVGKVGHTLQTIVSKQEFRSESMLDKHLVYFDFQQEIRMYYEKYTEGTREWVLEQVSTWFHDEFSVNRAFVISALAGMGKSVIAAVVCKRLAEHLDACHFFQYNNSRYNNSNSLLQSLAWQICKVFPVYREALIEKLSGNLGQSLNNTNLEGLFSLLFKEPFSSVAGNDRRVLIVLDAVDESEHECRQDLVNLIADHFQKLPSHIRFLITTRPDKNLIEKFGKLNPLFIEANDERNLNDIKLVLQKTIASASGSTADLIDTLAEKCDGLMLYASLLSEMCNDEPSIAEHFPQGLVEFYEKYLERLKRELKDSLEISEDAFLSFLSVLAVAMEPLPGAFIGSLFGFKKSSSNMKVKVRKAMNILSSLLVVKENKSISLFHKSIRDWLVDNPEHDYMTDEQYGHKILLDLCFMELNKLKKTDVKDVTEGSVALKYALKYYIAHMLNAKENKGKLENCVNNFVADLEVMFASVCVDVDLALNNIASLFSHKLYELVSENVRTTVKELFFVVRKFAFFLRDYPQSFLQHVVNECEKQISLKATHLLETRYRNIVYLEMLEKKKKRDAVKLHCFVSGTISSIDVSPEHDHVVCSYREGGIELFSLVTGKSEWKRQDFTVELPVFPSLQHMGYPVMLPHCIVFHPRESVILPGRLDMVLTLKGTFKKTKLFQCGVNDAKFTNCCFSKNGSRLVTNCGLDLVFWNTLNGEKEVHLECFSPLSSFSYTANGKFLGTTSIDNVFTVYDVMSRYDRVNSVAMPGHVEIVSTFEENCWFLLLDHQIATIGNDLSVSSRFEEVNDVVLPGNLYSCELKCALERTQKCWFLNVRRCLKHAFEWSSFTALRYIEISDESTLVFSQNLSALHVFSMKELKSVEVFQATKTKKVISNISTNGNLVYLNHILEGKIVVHVVYSRQKYLISYPQLKKSHLVVVKNGVILYGENRTPSLWNCGLTKCEESFDELTGTERCLSVSEEIIACIRKSDIIFFDVVWGKIVHRVNFTGDAQSIHACSINYHALIDINLWKDGSEMDAWTDIFSKHAKLNSISSAEFSPEGNRLALVSVGTNKVFIFDVISVTFHSRVPLFARENDFLEIKFFNNENLLCSSGNHVLHLIDVERGEILTCLDFGDVPAPLSVSREGSIVCSSHECSENFELIKVWLPRAS